LHIYLNRILIRIGLPLTLLRVFLSHERKAVGALEAELIIQRIKTDAYCLVPAVPYF